VFNFGFRYVFFTRKTLGEWRSRGRGCSDEMDCRRTGLLVQRQQRAVDLNWPSYELIRVVFADGMLFINVYLKGLHSKLKNFPFVNNIMILKDNKRKKKRKYFLAWILYKICVVPRLI